MLVCIVAPSFVVIGEGAVADEIVGRGEICLVGRLDRAELEACRFSGGRHKTTCHSLYSIPICGALIGSRKLVDHRCGVQVVCRYDSGVGVACDAVGAVCGVDAASMHA